MPLLVGEYKVAEAAVDEGSREAIGPTTTEEKDGGQQQV